MKSEELTAASRPTILPWRVIWFRIQVHAYVISITISPSSNLPLPGNTHTPRITPPSTDESEVGACWLKKHLKECLMKCMLQRLWSHRLKKSDVSPPPALHSRCCIPGILSLKEKWTSTTAFIHSELTCCRDTVGNLWLGKQTLQKQWGWENRWYRIAPLPNRHAKMCQWFTQWRKRGKQLAPTPFTSGEQRFLKNSSYA